MSGRPRKVSDEEIFHAVAGVVTAEGPSGLTLGAVADQVGLTAPALAQRFGSKRDLLIAFARSGDMGPVFEKAREGVDDPLEAIPVALVRMSAGITTRGELANNLAFLHMDLTDEELGKPTVKQSRVIRRHIATLIAEAKDAGTLGKVDPEELADTVYTIYNGSLIGWAIDGRGKLAQWLTERIERALAPYRVTGDV